ncbi:MAG: glycosyltransferase [Chthonomonadaceae bacterium]|nr:glycosyltransferase [Chthonomonadaceae bacterium]
MRIAIFSECYTPVTNGVVTSIVTLRQTLRAWGHRVFVFAPGTPQPDDDEDVFRLPELPFPRHPYHFPRPFPRLTIDFAALKVDVVHCQHPFVVGRLGAETARKHGIPMVYTAHSLYDTMVACSKSPIVRSMGPQAMRGVVRRFCAKADYVIAPTRHTRDSLRADLIEARFSIVASGVPPTQIRPGAREAIRHRLGISPQTPLLLYVGRLGPEKRLDVLVDGIALLNDGRHGDFKVALVGDGQERESLQHQIANLRLENRVTLTGGVPHSEIDDWYAASDIFVMPSPAETQGLVMVEAMSAGLPCVSVNEGGVAELTLQGITGIKTPLSPEAMAHALDCLIREPELRERMGAAGKERAAQFTPEAMTRNLLGVYEKAIHLPRLANQTSVQKFRTSLNRRTRLTKRTRPKRTKRSLF